MTAKFPNPRLTQIRFACHLLLKTSGAYITEPPTRPNYLRKARVFLDQCSTLASPDDGSILHAARRSGRLLTHGLFWREIQSAASAKRVICHWLYLSAKIEAVPTVLVGGR